MTDKINDYFTQGLIAQTFQAERNILIWQYIADEAAFLKSLDEHHQKLYGFLQRSAQTNYVLALGKLFDQPSNKYPTRCILSFLSLLTDPSLSPIPIIETTSTKKLLAQQNCPIELIESVESDDSRDFPENFAKHYTEQYNEPGLQAEIGKMKQMRDKAEAHNEEIDTLSLQFSTTSTLQKFALEIISVFGMAYHSTGWAENDHSMITISAKRNAAFVELSIRDLKNEISRSLQ
jgi:AbiU2